MTHHFDDSLRRSQEQANAPWWEECYRSFFPAFSSMTYVGDCPAQRDGVDRVVVTSNAHTYKIDEKVRYIDYDDFFLEYWSSVEQRRRGWVAKDLACDFIAYAFVPSRRCYLIPFPSLRRAWALNHEEWVRTYRPRDSLNEGYTTRGVPVPIDVALDAIRDAMLIRWSGFSFDPETDGAPGNHPPILALGGA